MAIHQTAQFQVKQDALEECEAAIRRFVEYVRANEPKTLLYLSLQDQADPTRFLHYFVFEDQAARERHSSSNAVNQFTGELYPTLVESVVFTDYIEFASST